MQCTHLSRSCSRNGAISRCRSKRALAIHSSQGYPPEQLSLVTIEAKPAKPQTFSAGPLSLCVVGALSVAAVVVAVGKYKKGSLNDLASRGYLGEAHEKKPLFEQSLPQQVDTVYIEPLSDDQIAAARARRSRERANTRVTLEDVDLPDNHPWAVKQPVSQEEEALIKARLSARRGLPVPSLNDAKQDQTPQKGATLTPDLQQV